MSRKAVVVMALLACGIGFAGPAPGASLELDAYGWNAQASGTVFSTQAGAQNSTVDLEDDLGMGRHLNGGGRLVFRYDDSFLPDILLQYDHVMSDGDTRLTKTVVWQGQTYQANGRIVSQAELKSGRVVFFWSPLDNAVLQLRTGIEARWIDLNLPVTGTVTRLQPPPPTTYQQSTSAGGVAWLPMLNLGLVFHLPAGLDVVTEGSYTHYSSSYLWDARAGLDYRFGFGLVLSAGWREFRLHLDDSSFSVNGDMKFKGFYGGLGVRF